MMKRLVIQLARFGDIVQSKRLILSLLRDGEVHVCVDRSLASLARLVYPDCVVHAVPAHSCDARMVLEEGRTLFERLHTERFDEVYTLNNAGLCKAVASLFPPETVRGYSVRSGQVQRCRWMRMAFRWMALRRCSPLNLADFWAALAPAPLSPALVNPPAAPGGKGLGIVLAGQVWHRSAPPEALALLTRIQAERLGGAGRCPVYLLGTAKEHPAAREVMSRLPGTIVETCRDLTGKTDWAALADVLSGLDLLLSPDTGTAHLAAHLGVPVMGLFCSSAWAWETGPYGLGHTILQTDLPCAPCVESSPCAQGVPCRAFFTDSDLLAYLAKKGKTARHFPQRVRILHSAFDEIGQIWQEESGPPRGVPVPRVPSAGTHEHDTRMRNALRAQLAEYLGLGGAHGTEAATLLYNESDWILPPLKP